MPCIENLVDTPFKQLEVLTLICLYLYELLSNVHTNYNEYTNQGPFNHHSKNNQSLKISQHRLLLCAYNPLYIGIKTYNKLLEE